MDESMTGASGWWERLWLRSAAFSRAAAYTASLLAIAPFFYHLAHHSTAYLGLLEDDYYYYVTIADRFVTLGKLTYDGTTLTNGFHPLWLAVLTILRFLCGGLGPTFYVILALLFLASALLTYELGRRFARCLGASAALSAAVAALYAVGVATLMSMGMECVVAVPLFLWWLVLIAQPVALTPRRAAWLGFVASLAVLARLDIAVAVAIAAAGYVLLVRPRWSMLWRVCLGFCTGGLLLALYGLANYVAFGTPLPVSALAKRLITAPGFSLPYVRGIALGTCFGWTVAVVLPLGVVALWRLIRTNPGEHQAARFSGAVALLFAGVFFFINALSGWIIFGWYAYPLAPAVIAAVVFICENWPPPRYLRQAAIIGMLAWVALAPLNGVRHYIEHGPSWSINDNALLSASYDLSRHIRPYSGTFAMGAVAGMAAYVSGRPFVQLEGLVSDRRMVEHVGHQDRLDNVLREYHVDYLVVSFVGIPPRRGTHGCYLVTQPEQQWAGTRTAKMKGEICSEPAEHFFTEAGTNPWSEFPRVETLVWDVRRAQWQ